MRQETELDNLFFDSLQRISAEFASREKRLSEQYSAIVSQHNAVLLRFEQLTTQFGEVLKRIDELSALLTR